MHNAEAVIRTENLTRIYTTGKIQLAALNDVNLAVSEGSFLGITGASGSGKSTLMNLLGGLDTPTRGEIYVQGKYISGMDNQELAEYRRFGVGMIFQSFNLISSFSAQENVGLPLLFADVRKKQRKERALQMLDRVGLAPRKDHRPSELSGGEQQRVAIARALINQPKILLADEPTGNLDSRTSRDIVELLAQLNSQGLTLAMVSHEEALLREFAQNIVCLKDGMVSNRERLA
jgi:putative ABC transport system ATP-binding protein